MSFRTLGKIELLCALALFLVQEWILALIFGGLGVFMLFGIKEQPKKQTTLAKKAPAPKKPAPVQKQNSLSQQKTAPAGAPATGWSCSCGVINTGKFCTECGRTKPAENGWTCVCGEHNTGKFCADCGKPKPTAKSAVSVPKDSEPLTFLLRKNGAPKAGIILCGKYEWNTEKIYSTMEACKKAKIPCLRFMREFRNDAGYVTARIRKALR